MKITEIRIDRTKSLGNYENIKLGFTAVIDEAESEVGAVERLKRLLDWEINREERDAQYAKYTKQLEAGETNGKTDAIQKWVAQYDSLAQEFTPTF
jgi:hypothetical protein